MTPLTDLSVKYIDVNGVTLAYFEQGSGPLLLCLHGFPDSAYTYNDQAAQLARQGYRVIVPFLRGYYPSSCAIDGDYTLPTLARDILALIDALYEGEGSPKAALIGHDWGGLAAYHAANLAPEKIQSLTCMAIPHMHSAKTTWQQFKNMWYILFFQLPLLPEYFMRRNKNSFIDFIYRRWSPSWKASQFNIAAFKNVISNAQSLVATLAYYRCMVRKVTPESKTLMKQITTVPALWIVGKEDRSVDISQVDGIEQSFSQGLELQVLSGVGHFPHRENPEQVTQLITDFLAKQTH